MAGSVGQVWQLLTIRSGQPWPYRLNGLSLLVGAISWARASAVGVTFGRFRANHLVNLALAWLRLTVTRETREWLGEYMRRLAVAVLALLAACGAPLNPTAANSRVGEALGSRYPGVLSGVSAASATDAWAVGDHFDSTSGTDLALLLHWNGKSWTPVSAPSLGGTHRSILSGVSADSATDAWAVGDYVDPTTATKETLILRWNGRNWIHVESPNPGGIRCYCASILTGVSAESTTDAWAVGDYLQPISGARETLILHWDGARWSQVSSPNPGGTNCVCSSVVTGVSAASATDAWAVGYYQDETGPSYPLVLHWNGTSWRQLQVASLNPGAACNCSGSLTGVSAGSATDAWAVGGYGDRTTHASETLIVHWNGNSWNRVDSPSPGGTAEGASNDLYGVSARSAADAWAVGKFSMLKTGATGPLLNLQTGAIRTLVLHWNGVKWSQVASPNPGGTNCQCSSAVYGVSAYSATSGWAAGLLSQPAQPGLETLMLRW